VKGRIKPLAAWHFPLSRKQLGGPLMSDVPRSWRRRWLVRLIVVAVLVALLILFRQPILRGLAGQLIVDDLGAENSTVLILNGDRSPELAVKAFQDGKTREILVIDWRPDRPVRLGILPEPKTVERQVLVKQGVPDEAIKEMPGQVRDMHQVAVSINFWLSKHPDRHLTVYCGRFGSRYVDVVFRRALGEQRWRVHLHAVAHPEYDEDDWWRNKSGLKSFWQENVRLAFLLTHGAPRHDETEWDADAYERALR
jgi:hypothetical protein